MTQGTVGLRRSPTREHGHARFAAALVVLIALAGARPAIAQDSVSGVLSFLLTPRSIDTGDAAADTAAAEAVGRAFTASVPSGSALLPAATSGGGFAYRLDSALGGAVVRSSSMFGALFTERALTVGQGVGTLDLNLRRTSYDAFDGRRLRDGTLSATALRIAGETEPLDVETITLHLDASVATLTGTYGLTDRLDLTGVLPFVWLTLRGERSDLYQDEVFLLSTAEATTAGVGDIAVRLKYNLVRRLGSGIALTAQWRLPTGREEDLLGSGETTLQPGVVGSFERGSLALDGNIGYMVGGLSRELAYGGAVTVMRGPRLMLIGELSGRRLGSTPHLADVAAPNASLTGIETIRLSAVDEPAHRITAIGGVKWNPSGPWLVSVSLLRRITSGGLTATWVPGVSLEYIFGR